MDTEELKDQLRQIPRTPIKPEDFLSSSSTLLNLGCSGLPNGAFSVGHYYWFVGESSSGKTFLLLATLAEASINPRFDDYDLVYDDIEGGALMDIERYFGQKLADRIEPPRLVAGEAQYSQTIEDVYFNLDDRLEQVENGKANKFIWIVDSVDAATSKYEMSKFREKKTAHRKNKEAKGDYGDGKAAINSRWIRGIVSRLRKTGCIVIFVSQERDNINAGLFEDDRTAAGGRALKFYSTCQLWSSVGKKLTKDVNDKARQIGIVCRVQIRKNRLTGKEWSIEFPIFWSHGIDDIGSCIDFLINEKHWYQSASTVTANEFDFVGSKMKLLQKIEQEDLEPKLRSIVVGVWNDIVSKCVVERKSRYS